MDTKEALEKVRELRKESDMIKNELERYYNRQKFAQYWMTLPDDLLNDVISTAVEEREKRE